MYCPLCASMEALITRIPPQGDEGADCEVSEEDDD